MDRQKTVVDFIERNQHWHQELVLLRETALAQKLDETIKWGFPVYTYQGKNVVGLGAFKSYVGLWFFQGGLLKDQNNHLMNAQDGKTKAMRQWRFKDLRDIKKSMKLIEIYLQEAIDNQKKGLTIKPERNKPVDIPKELQDALSTETDLQNHFNNLSLSKRRDFAEYITTAKRSETKLKRLVKILPMIKAGIGMNDQYKK